MAKHLLVSERCLIFRNTPLRYNQRALEKRMNERHEQLMAQAWIEFAPDAKAVTNRFAELIVAECLSIVKSNTYSPNGEYDYSYSDEDSAADRRAETIYEEIAYRFGVAE